MFVKSPILPTWFYRPEGVRREDELRIVLPCDKKTFRVMALEHGWFVEVAPKRFQSLKAAQQWVLRHC